MDLTPEQTSVVRWQWITLFASIGLAFLVFFGAALLQMPQQDAILFAILLVGGLSNVVLGYLSIRYRVTILGRRIKFWEPQVEGTAVLHGWISVIGGAFLVAYGGYLSLASATSTGLLFLAILLFGTLALALIVLGLRRAFGNQE